MVDQSAGNGTEVDSTKILAIYAYGSEGAATEDGVIRKSTVEHSWVQFEQNLFQIDVVFESLVMASK